MTLAVLSYENLLDPENTVDNKRLQAALLQKGIVGIKGVPDFENKSRAYIDAARAFSQLDLETKQAYVPDRDAGVTEGYELGAEHFQTPSGAWQVDDKKASYYAYVPDKKPNVWPKEVDLRTAYLELGELIFSTGKVLLNAIGLNESLGIPHTLVHGYGRMLHYQKEVDKTNSNPEWCGAHLDHGLFTGLIPAYYFCEGQEVEEPEEAGLFIVPTDGDEFEKIDASDKSILLFQVGEFGQLMTNDRIKATRHKVKKSHKGIERYSYALFYLPDGRITVNSQSILKNDLRYAQQQAADGSLCYQQWANESYARYRAK